MMDILSRPTLAADHRIAYGPDRSQFGDLWLPAGDAEHSVPLVVFFHGGWWKSEYDLGYAGHLCDALKREGMATWSVEYRRVGSTGGGWPATFLDAAAGFDFSATLAKRFPLDLRRVITMGHSAGGHLAFWIAGRHHLPRGSELSTAGVGPSLRGAISLAGAVDLRLTIDLAGECTFAHDRDEVINLMGGTPQQFPERYRQGNPGDLVPLRAPQFLLQGADDDQIPPELPHRWAEFSRALGPDASVTIIPKADHFGLVDPDSHAWPVVLEQVKLLLR